MSMGGGGGGGTSGNVQWPTYFQNWHEAVLGSPIGSEDVVSILNTAWASNPFTGLVAYDPDAGLATVDTAVGKVVTLAEALSPVADWHTYLVAVRAGLDDHVFSTTELAAAEVAYNAVIDADYVNVTLPRFQRGMQDANAVMSSAFVVGKALLDAEVTRKKATFSADLRLQDYKEKINSTMNGIESMIRLVTTDNQYRNTVASTVAEVNRMKAVLLKEEADRNATLDELAAKWEMETLTYAGNFLAAGHGGTSQSGMKATPMQSVMGGALSGAAAGTAIGGPGIGTGIGALAGGLLGMFGSR
jgi:hypothetical protein